MTTSSAKLNSTSSAKILSICARTWAGFAPKTKWWPDWMCSASMWMPSWWIDPLLHISRSYCRLTIAKLSSSMRLYTSRWKSWISHKLIRIEKYNLLPSRSRAASRSWLPSWIKKKERGFGSTFSDLPSTRTSKTCTTNAFLNWQSLKNEWWSFRQKLKQLGWWFVNSMRTSAQKPTNNPWKRLTNMLTRLSQKKMAISKCWILLKRRSRAPRKR